MNEREINHIVAEILQRCKARDRKCFIDSCNEKAINSHLIQKNGILSHICENDHFYEMKLQQFPTQHFSIVRQGVNKGMAFKGFCSKHDNELFVPIEQQQVDFTVYKNQLLACYRAVLREYREKENILEVYKRVSESRSIKYYINLFSLKMKHEAEQYLLWDTEFVLNEINKDLVEQSESFLFKSYNLPKVQVCASAIYST